MVVLQPSGGLEDVNATLEQLSISKTIQKSEGQP